MHGHSKRHQGPIALRPPLEDRRNQHHHAEGVMTDGNGEVEEIYAGIVAQSASAFPSKRLTGGVSVSHPQESFALRFNMQNDRFVDASTGLPLDEGLCRAARKKDIYHFISKSVWELRTINEARTKMGRSPISVRWVEVNKGDVMNPNIRSRLVAREIRTAGQDAIFAPTPPPESWRMVLSMATKKFEGGRDSNLVGTRPPRTGHNS